MAASKTPRVSKRSAQRAPAAEPGPTTRGRLLDLAEIRALAKVVNQYDLTEVELESGNERLRIRRDRTNGVAPVTVVSQPVDVPRPHLTTGVLSAEAPRAEAAKSEEPSDGSMLITSPFVGTFYRAPSPESPPFVEVGQTVKKGQVLCIVEAMKLMNEIEAETSCKILEVLAQNAEPVEFGQALFRVFPLA